MTETIQDIDDSSENDVSIPTKTVDESATVEERLTDNTVDNILPARYLDKDSDGNVIETPKEMFERVAANVAKAENGEANEEYWRGQFEQQMKQLKFMPNSPTLMNAGLELQQLSACFVLEPQDDMDDILETVWDAGIIFKSGGGVGYTFSHLRPRGTLVQSTKGTSSGPISFMQLFNEVCNQVKQGGTRRGAQMAILRVDHPDIGRFVTAKRDENNLNNFNISVGVTDAFVEAVENDETYTLYDPQKDYQDAFSVVEQTRQFYHPQYADNPQIDNIWNYSDEIQCGDQTMDEKWGHRDWDELLDGEMELPARFIWDTMIDGAWRNGEPGLFYLDETNRQHSFDVDKHPEHEIHATNPCLAAGTTVQTPDGPRDIQNISVGDEISTVRGSESVDEIETFSDRDVFKVTFNDGGSVFATEDHRFHTLDGKKSTDVALRNLNEGEHVRLERTEMRTTGTGEQYKRQLRRGILLGDGCYTKDTIEHNNRAAISTSESDTAYNSQLVELFESAGYSMSEDKSGGGKSMKYWIPRADELLEEHGIEPAKSHEKSVDVSEFDTEAQIVGFLDGLLASDGNINTTSNRPQVRWTTSSNDLARVVRTLCLNIGCHARIYEDTRKERGGTREDGSKILTNNTVDDVHIAGESLRSFANKSLLDEIHPSKGEQLQSTVDEWMLTGGTWKTQIASIEEVDDTETVYDFYCSGSDTWVAEGYVHRGCAEQPLSNYEACNLGHVNLSLFKNERAPTYPEYDGDIESYMHDALNMGELTTTIRTGVRFLDNVATMSEFPLDEIEDTVDEMRKIGLGVMGWAQLLYQMDIRYGSDESLELGNELMNFIDMVATEGSHQLAKEKGVFESWHESKYADPMEHGEWFENHVHKYPTHYEDGYEMRNHNVTTVAPTGTTSMIADTSGGIEPVYNVAYRKHVGDDIGQLVEFDSYFETALEANGYDVDRIKQDAAALMERGDYDGPEDLPISDELAAVFTTTDDVSPREHTMMQRMFQDGVDSGISKTINLPSEASRADVSDAYSLALVDYADGAPIKGMTVYRDQSRSQQVLTTQEHSDADIERAKELLESQGYTVEE